MSVELAHSMVPCVCLRQTCRQASASRFLLLLGSTSRLGISCATYTEPATLNCSQGRLISKHSATMSAEKRAASGSFGANQLVKRQRSDGNLNGSSALVASGSNGALVKVWHSPLVYECLPHDALK